MRRTSIFALAVAFSWLLGAQLSWAQKSNDKEHAELAKALKGVKTSLEKGLSASESQGKPISGKFELEDGKLQLSVYTMKGDKFSEVIIDHKTGKVAKTEAITGGKDLTAAKAQSEAPWLRQNCLFVERRKKLLRRTRDSAPLAPCLP
jgi:hypothetical protein